MVGFLPPSPAVAQCVAAASAQYGVPDLLLYAIMRQEGGRPGTVSRNKNRTVDMGRMQINSSWLPTLAPLGYTAEYLTWNDCGNIMVAAWILKSNYQKFGNQWNAWPQAIMAYNVGQPKSFRTRGIGWKYARSVLAIWQQGYNREVQRLASN
jgi:soluble lytic murein transglycosylase-like protein